MAQKKTSKSSGLRVVEPKINDPAARAAAVRKAAKRVRTTVTIDPKGRPSEPHSRQMTGDAPDRTTAGK